MASWLLGDRLNRPPGLSCHHHSQFSDSHLFLMMELCEVTQMESFLTLQIFTKTYKISDIREMNPNNIFSSRRCNIISMFVTKERRIPGMRRQRSLFISPPLANVCC